ncbi:PIR protein [Plasmodium ovale]|nr:PIR protein [Plasmodium ovale]
MFTAEQCKKLGSLGNIDSVLPGGLLDLCDCLDGGISKNTEKCKCSDVLTNDGLTTAFLKFKDCFGSNTESNTASNKESNMGILKGLFKGLTTGLPGGFASMFSGAIPGDFANVLGGNLTSPVPGNSTNVLSQGLGAVSHEGSNTEQKENLKAVMPKNNLKFITGNCYISSLKDILSSLNGNTICDVNISSYKEKAEKIIEYLEAIENAAGSTLKYVNLINSGVILGESLFWKVIKNYSNYNIVSPLCVSGFIVVIIIGILFMIYKSIPRSFFGSRMNKDEQNYDEQMKILQEQYNETLRTTAMLNKYLLGYQPD